MSGIASTDIHFYRAFSSGANRGLINEEEEISSATLENIFPNVTVTQARDGATEYKKFFIKNQHATNAWENLVAWISSVTPSEHDEISLAVGSDTDYSGESELLKMTATSVITLQSTGIDTRVVTLVGEDILGQLLVEDVTLTNATPTTSVNQFSRLYNAAISTTSGDLIVTIKQGTRQLGTIGIVIRSAMTFYTPTSKPAGFKMGSLIADDNFSFWLKRVVDAGAIPVDNNQLGLAFEGETT